MSNSANITEFNNRFKSEIALLISQLKLEIRKELRDQGHVLTGTLERSIEDEVKETVFALSFLIYLEEYGVNIDRGILPEKIPYTRGSGAGSSKYIDGLKRYWQLRGLPPMEAKRAAFATANKHKQEGMPTRGSYGFSNNGRRLGFFSGTIDRNVQHIENAVNRAAESVITATLFNILDKTQREFKTA